MSIIKQELKEEISDSDFEQHKPQHYIFKTFKPGKSTSHKLFQKESLPTKHQFKEGHKLECIDPENQNLICVVSVKKIQGCRLLLHFDGYGEEHNFWENAASQNLFPAGWCRTNAHVLTPPKGYTSANFPWPFYLNSTKSSTAPKSLFNKQCPFHSTPNWAVGMKLEAEDKYDRSVIAVATVTNIIGLSGGSDHRVLIHFDGWTHDYDYWTSINGPYVHSAGWCEENNRDLEPPKGFGSEAFSWNSYLLSTSSKKVPASGFRNSEDVQESKFEVGMQVEAVDLRNPRLIRLAKVADVDERQIKLHYEGWSHKFDLWVDDSDARIYPLGYCEQSGHPPLMPPLPPEEIEAYIQKMADCPVPGCLGIGHVMGAQFPKHSRASDCPYSKENFDAESKIPCRLQDGQQTQIREEEDEIRRKSRKRKK